MNVNLNLIMQDVKGMIREPFAFPGAYTKILVMTDGECLCVECVKSNYKLISEATRNNLHDGWQAQGVTVHWEGEPLNCAHCGKELKAEYTEE